MSRTWYIRKKECTFPGKPFVHWLTAVVLASICGAMPATNAYAQWATVRFDIPAQPVSSALQVYARQAKVNLLVTTDGLNAIDANAVVGSFNPQDALQILLAGTGLHAKYRPDATVAIGRESDGVEEAVREDDEILLPGAWIRGAKNASAVTRFTREEIERAWVTSVNLRDSGVNSTLILLNSRLLSPSGLAAYFTSISLSPVAAIERVEVLTNGAPARFGSGAGGAVSIILRDHTGATGCRPTINNAPKWTVSLSREELALTMLLLISLVAVLAKWRIELWVMVKIWVSHHFRHRG